MKSLKIIIVVTVIVFSTVFSLAQYGARHQQNACSSGSTKVTTTTIAETEDLSFAHLLTLKFM